MVNEKDDTIKCDCGKPARFLNHGKKAKRKFLCADCVPPVVKLYEFCEGGFLSGASGMQASSQQSHFL